MYKDFGKGTPEFSLMQDFWSIWKKYAIPENTDEYWQSLLDCVAEVVEKYKNTELENLSAEIFTSLISHFEKVSKQK